MTLLHAAFLKGDNCPAQMQCRYERSDLQPEFRKRIPRRLIECGVLDEQMGVAEIDGN